MKLRMPRDVPFRATAVVLALALVAGVVAGRDEPPTQSTPLPQAAAASAPAQPSLPDLDLDKLNRTPKSGKVADLFATKIAMVAPPAAPVVAVPPAAPPPPPTAPALPFRYFGKWEEGGRTAVFLSRGGDSYSVFAGESVDANYRVEAISDSSVEFVYLPLGTRQTLSIPETN